MFLKMNRGRSLPHSNIFSFVFLFWILVLRIFEPRFDATYIFETEKNVLVVSRRKHRSMFQR